MITLGREDLDLILIKDHIQAAAIVPCFDDGTVRKMVLEVNSGNEDMLSIISDLKGAGIAFL